MCNAVCKYTNTQVYTIVHFVAYANLGGGWGWGDGEDWVYCGQEVQGWGDQLLSSPAGGLHAYPTYKNISRYGLAGVNIKYYPKIHLFPSLFNWNIYSER